MLYYLEDFEEAVNVGFKKSSVFLSNLELMGINTMINVQCTKCKHVSLEPLSYLTESVTAYTRCQHCNNDDFDILETQEEIDEAENGKVKVYLQAFVDGVIEAGKNVEEVLESEISPILTDYMLDYGTILKRTARVLLSYIDTDSTDLHAGVVEMFTKEDIMRLLQFDFDLD